MKYITRAEANRSFEGDKNVSGPDGNADFVTRFFVAERHLD